MGASLRFHSMLFPTKMFLRWTNNISSFETNFARRNFPSLALFTKRNLISQSSVPTEKCYSRSKAQAASSRNEISANVNQHQRPVTRQTVCPRFKDVALFRSTVSSTWIELHRSRNTRDFFLGARPALLLSPFLHHANPPAVNGTNGRGIRRVNDITDCPLYPSDNSFRLAAEEPRNFRLPGFRLLPPLINQR